MSAPLESVTRRSLLASLLATSCARKSGSGYRGWAFVALRGSRPAIAAVDLLGFQVRKRVDLEAPPASVFPHPDPGAGRVLALVPKGRALVEIDIRTLAITRTLRLPAPPAAAKPSLDGRAIWSLLPDPPMLHGIDLADGKTLAQIPLPGRPVSWDLHPKEAAAAVATDSGSLLFVDLAAARFRLAGELGADPGPIAFRSDGRVAAAANRAERMLCLFDCASGERIVDLPLSLRPDRFCMLRDGGQLFITGVGQDAVVIAYPYRTEIAQTTLSGRRPAEMAASDAPPYLFVSNPDAGSLTVFNIANQKVVAVTGVGIRPGPIAVTPDQQYALVLHSGSGDLGVIRIASITTGRAKAAPLFTMVPLGEDPIGLTVVPSPVT